MTPIEHEMLERKRELIARELKLIRELIKRRVSKKSDLILQHALCHSLQNAISATIDIAQHIVAERTSAVPQSYSESIELLAQAKILPKKFAFEFSQVAKLRNVVVHAYENLDVDYLASILPKFVKDMSIFIKATKKI